jgi:hypothetical protein
MRGEVTGVTTASLIAEHGPIVSRGCRDGYQFIEFAGGKVYESSRINTTWLPWGRRPCNNAERLARRMSVTREIA